MQVSPRVPPSRFAAVTFVALAMFATACSGGARPTLTGDRLDQSAIATNETAAEQESAADTANGSQTGDPQPLDTPNADPPAAAEGEGQGQGEDAADDVASIEPVPWDGVVERLSIQVLETIPRDPLSYTQGLELHDGFLFESTGSRGPDNVLDDSRLQRVDPTTGRVEQSITIDQPFFAEGLTKVGDQLIQLTWKANVAFYRDASSFEIDKQVSYPGEGWGLCYDGTRLVMSDGSSTLVFRDPTTFEEIGRVVVNAANKLNELECVDGFVWANVFGTDEIVRIDPATGDVTGVVDASSLERPLGDGGAVLNGIAWDPASASFYITGKLWPTMYRVNFVAVPQS